MYTEQAKERQGVNLSRQRGHEFWDKNESLGDKEVPQWTCNFCLVGEEKEQLAGQETAFKGLCHLHIGKSPSSGHRVGCKEKVM